MEKKLGIIKLDTIIKMNNCGKLPHTSKNRPINKSVLPPKYPCKAPTINPIDADKIVNVIPNIKLNRNAYNNLANTSRP